RRCPARRCSNPRSRLTLGRPAIRMRASCRHQVRSISTVELGIGLADIPSFRRASAAALLAGVAAFALAPGPASAAEAEGGGWPLAGQNLANGRSEPGETAIGTANVGKLKPRWVFTTHGEVSATPTVAGGIVYFPDWGGYLNAVDAETGRLLWQKRIPEYTQA